MRLYLGTNIALDVLAKREPFAVSSAKIWALAESRRIEGLISAISFTTIFYVTRRAHSRSHASDAMKILRGVFGIVPCDAAVIHRAIDADFTDFEDAVQYFSALAASVDALVTRNADHFPTDELAVMTPAAFLAAHVFE